MVELRETSAEKEVAAADAAVMKKEKIRAGPTLKDGTVDTVEGSTTSVKCERVIK